MYDKHYLEDAIRGWRSECKNCPTMGLDFLMRLIMQIYERDIIQMENIEFLKNFRKYTSVEKGTSTKVYHEDKVVGEVNRASDNKVVVRLLRHQRGHLPDAASCEEHELTEIHITVVERPPEYGVPGVVAISIDTCGIQKWFMANTDSGNHKRTLRDAKYLLQSIAAEKR